MCPGDHRLRGAGARAGGPGWVPGFHGCVALAVTSPPGTQGSRKTITAEVWVRTPRLSRARSRHHLSLEVGKQE